MGIGRGIALVDVELVEIIVDGNVLEGRGLFVSRKWALCKAELFRPRRRNRRPRECEPRRKREDFAPIEVYVFGSNLGCPNIACWFDEHVLPPSALRYST